MKVKNNYMGLIASFKLNKNQAECIKHWRCNLGYSWRGIARLVDDHFPELKANSGNQIDGMQLCEDAMNLLNEKVGDGWN
jgi:hypothetical protein